MVDHQPPSGEDYSGPWFRLQGFFLSSNLFMVKKLGPNEESVGRIRGCSLQKSCMGQALRAQFGEVGTPPTWPVGALVQVGWSPSGHVGGSW